MSDDPSQPQASNLPLHRDTQALAPSVPEPPVKKTRSRKKSETKTPATPAEQGSGPQASPDVSPVPAPPKRGRRKKSAEPEAQDGETSAKVPSHVESEAMARQIDAEDHISSPKPKRTRRVGEPKPKRYAVGESETSQIT